MLSVRTIGSLALGFFILVVLYYLLFGSAVLEQRHEKSEPPLQQGLERAMQGKDFH